MIVKGIPIDAAFLHDFFHCDLMIRPLFQQPQKRRFDFLLHEICHGNASERME